MWRQQAHKSQERLCDPLDPHADNARECFIKALGQSRGARRLPGRCGACVGGLRAKKGRPEGVGT
jgi:hypothetical protein